MGKMFNFDPASYADAFANRGYVHIAKGLTQEFHSQLVRHIHESFRQNHLKDFARGDKQQALYEFLEPNHYHELQEVVATICGLDTASLLVSERHIKGYEADADPYPLAHKDRFGSEVAVGFSIQVPEGSTLVLYPEHDVGANPFNSSAELRSSFCAHTAPELELKNARRVEIHDKPRDVMLFRGSAMWHLRERAAGTTVIYLKLNTYNCDTLGEDRHGTDVRQRSLDLLGSSYSTFLASIPVIARKVDYVHRRYNRDWNEVLGVVVFGEPHATINGTEFEVLRAMDGRRTVADIAEQMQRAGKQGDAYETIRRLAERGFVDLLTQPLASGQIGRRLVERHATVASM
jgi:hypothetical protein